MERFSFQNYIAMYKARGLRLVWDYFVHNHLYDLVHKTDTHAWDTQKPSSNAGDDYAIYMTTWAKDVQHAMGVLETEILPGPISFYDLVDLGCGKGKVLLTWRKQYKDQASIIGLEYNKALCDICLKNFEILQLSPPRIDIGGCHKCANKRAT